MFKRDVSINALLYILHCMGGECDMHKCAKILYFADMEHLSMYGKSITGDNYIAMKYGPVPSRIFDIEKAVRGDSAFAYAVDDIRENMFRFKNNRIMVSISKPDMDYLSESNVEVLNKWIEELRNKSFNEVTNMSHGYAYMQTAQNETIDMSDILTEAGDTQEYINFVKGQIMEADYAFA